MRGLDEIITRSLDRMDSNDVATQVVKKLYELGGARLILKLFGLMILDLTVIRFLVWVKLCRRPGLVINTYESRAYFTWRE